MGESHLDPLSGRGGEQAVATAAERLEVVTHNRPTGQSDRELHQRASPGLRERQRRRIDLGDGSCRGEQVGEPAGRVLDRLAERGHQPGGMRAGGAGTICGVANVYPGIVRALLARDVAAEDATRIHRFIDVVMRFPFLPAFKKVHDAVQKQQGFETPMIKQTIHNLAYPAKGKEKPSEADAKKIADDAAAEQAKLSEAAVKAVEPVKHTIKIEVVK